LKVLLFDVAQAMSISEVDEAFARAALWHMKQKEAQDGRP
jgi:hypothetical protein